MIEFALVLPVILLLVFFTIDAARLVYTYNSLDSIARDGARTVSLSTQLSTDCLTLQRVIEAGQGYPISTDPNSQVGDSDPNNPAGSLQPTTPVPGQGYVYIYPAVAPNPPGPSNCNGSPRSAADVQDVEVYVDYNFQPLTPLASTLFHNTIIVKAISVEKLEPCPGSAC